MSNKNLDHIFRSSKIYVINLDRDVHRWQGMVEQVQKQNLSITRFPAIYGRALSDKQKKDATTSSCYKHSTPSIIGCGLSHKGVWQKILDENLDLGIILEDDALLVDDFVNKLNVVFFGIT